MKYLLTYDSKAVLKDDFLEIKKVHHPHLCKEGWGYFGEKKDGHIRIITFGKELKEGDTLEQLADIIIDGKPYVKSKKGFQLIEEEKL